MPAVQRGDPRPRPPNKRKRNPLVRSIGNDIWNQHRAEVYELYVKRYPPLSLDHLMAFFQTNHAFSPSRKQWKDRLSKWEFHRNLSVSSAAVILKLFQDAEQQGTNRRVFYNDREKSIDDIRKYISKSDLVEDERDLLSHLPSDDNWRKIVTWVDSTATLSAQHSIGAEQFHPTQPAPFADPYTRLWNAGTDYTHIGHVVPNIATHEPQVLDSSFDLPGNLFPDPFNLLDVYPNSEMVQRECYVPDRHAPGSHSQVPWDYPSGFVRVSPNPRTQVELSSCSSDEDESLSEAPEDQQQLPGIPPPAFESFIQPLFHGQAAQMPSTTPLADLNLAMSITPALFPFSDKLNGSDHEKALEAYITRILGTAQDFHCEPEKLFVNSCLKAMGYLGQHPDGQSALTDSAVQETINTFRDMTRNAFVATLPCLNLMCFVFGVYGHEKLKTRILQHLRDSVSLEDRYKQYVLAESLKYLLDTTSWGPDKFAVNKQRTESIYNTAVEISGRESQLAIAARYNQAWVLLEGREAVNALSILNVERSRCETVCGIYALQTMSWIATQARAHLVVGEPQTAEALMNEVVLTRTKRAFSEDNAIYWEVAGRIGLFMLKFAADKSIPSRTQECWDVGEDLSRKTLVWRGRWLGLENPKTAKMFRWLKYYLELQGKKREADNLFNWYRAEAANQ